VEVQELALIGLQYLRTIRRLTQRQLAKRSGVDASHISLIETGRLKPLPHELDALADALDVKPHVLLAPVVVVETGAQP